MVTCNLQGGIGNQLFIIAATIGLATINNTDYKIPQNSIDPNRKAIFKHFPILMPDEIKSIYNEPAFTYTDIPYQDGICLNGFFQSYKYFDHCREEIVKAFNIPYEINHGIVSIHVRRSDYLLTPEYHPVLTMKYYTAAIEHFLDYGYQKFIVFSDAMDWGRSNLNKDNFPLCDFEYSEGNTALKDMELMQNCEHQIIANSSFSWWGAWLNQNPKKIVVAPVTWFGKEGPKDTEDLIPEQWIKL